MEEEQHRFVPHLLLGDEDLLCSVDDKVTALVVLTLAEVSKVLPEDEERERTRERTRERERKREREKGQT